MSTGVLWLVACIIGATVFVLRYNAAMAKVPTES